MGRVAIATWFRATGWAAMSGSWLTASAINNYSPSVVVLTLAGGALFAFVAGHQFPKAEYEACKATNEDLAAENLKLTETNRQLTDQQRMLERAVREPPASEAEFCRLAKEDVAGLTEALSPGLELKHLTFAAEAVAEVINLPYTLRKRMFALLKHDMAYVREGALYGLEPHMALSSLIRSRVEDVARDDPDKDVRDMATEMLE